MKIVEDYAQRVAQRKVDQTSKIIVNLYKNELNVEEIASKTQISRDFINETLSK